MCKTKCPGLEKRNLKRMISEEPHGNWQTKPPSAGLGPSGSGKAKASGQSEGIREQETGGSLHGNEDGTVASPGS